MQKFSHFLRDFGYTMFTHDLIRQLSIAVLQEKAVCFCVLRTKTHIIANNICKFTVDYVKLWFFILGGRNFHHNFVTIILNILNKEISKLVASACSKYTKRQDNLNIFVK